MMPPLAKYLPHASALPARERFRSAGGALLGILCAGLLVHVGPLERGSATSLIAPMGASSVLLFAAPSSPLAHPWAVIGGNTLAALIGVTAALLIPNAMIAAALAVCLAIVAMFALRCLHPPSGAVALTAVLGGASIHQAGYAFALTTVAAQSVVLVLLAIGYHRMTGHRYPHVAPPAKTSTRIQREHIEAVLAREDEFVDIDVADLERIVLAVEREAGRATLGPAPARRNLT